MIEIWLWFLSVATPFAGFGAYVSLRPEKPRRNAPVPQAAGPRSIAIGYEAVAGPWRPGPIVVPAPVQPREDTSWMDVVGIPFELWCSVGRCHGPSGYELGAMVAYLVGRRDAGDFREPVDLVKRYRRLPAKVEKPDPYSFCAPVGGSEPIKIAKTRDEYGGELALMTETFEGQGALRAVWAWRGEHRQCEQWDDRMWPDYAECLSCDEQMTLVRHTVDEQFAVIRWMAPPPNPGLGGRR